MSSSSTVEADAGGTALRILRSLVTDPARCFLAIGAVGGALLVCIIPALGGIDEPAHFARAYQISTGRLTTQRAAGADEGGGVCLPGDVATEFDRLVKDYHDSVLERADPAVREQLDETNSRPFPEHRRSSCARGERFYDISAFAWNSPVAYLPQAVAIDNARLFGLNVRGQVYAARIAVLASYLVLVFLAIRRSPYARWGLCAVGLLPVALFQAVSSRAPDAITIGVAMFVLVSALRAVRAGTDRGAGSPYAERIALAALLGFMKPTYSVVSLCFLLPLRARPRPNLAFLVAPIFVAVGISAVWQLSAGDNFVCDTFAFGIHADPAEQMNGILGSPHRYAIAVLSSFRDYGGKWLEDTATVGETVANWSWPMVALALVAVTAAAAKRDPRERFDLVNWQRALPS